MTKLPEGAWVLVADGEKALILENHGDEEHPNLQVRRKEEQDNPPTREQAANKRGRMSDGAGGPISAYDDTDWHEIAKERFAHDLADLLYARGHAQKYEHLVLVAGPNILGELRKTIHKEVAGKVIGEIPKTLTGHPLNEIEAAVIEALAEAE